MKDVFRSATVIQILPRYCSAYPKERAKIWCRFSFNSWLLLLCLQRHWNLLSRRPAIQTKPCERWWGISSALSLLFQNENWSEIILRNFTKAVNTRRPLFIWSVGKHTWGAALRQQLARSLGSLVPSQGTRSVSSCQAEGCKNGRSAPNPNEPYRVVIVVVVVLWCLLFIISHL